MTSSEIRKKFLDYFEKNGHKVVPSSSLIPSDPSVLLTTAGMQQFKKYYVGEADPQKDFGSRNTTSAQKCFRTSDIDEVGDETHLTFFEMLGNFSFGGYFKEEAIKYGYEFITKELGLEIDYVTVFSPEGGSSSGGEGDSEVPKDEESEKIWRSLGVENIKYAGRSDNFWGPTGSEGPCGPTTEIYVGGIEIWNIVFNEYYMRADKSLEPLKQKGVDTGMGLERLTMAVQGVKNIFETDLFEPIIREIPNDISDSVKRVIADHLRGSLFLISDGVVFSNKGVGAVLKRLIRRAVVESVLSINNEEKIKNVFRSALQKIIGIYGDIYPKLDKVQTLKIYDEEVSKTIKGIPVWFKESDRQISNILKGLNLKEEDDRFIAFSQIQYIAATLYNTFGVPLRIIKERLASFGLKVDDQKLKEAFEIEFKKHQEISRAGMEKKFGGHGLILNTGELKAGNEEELGKVLRLHTATHLLQRALREVLGPEVKQAGSDITPERTRFDFAYPRKLTPEEVKSVEDLVNQKIKEDLPVSFKEMPKAEAEKTGALYFFKEKYPDPVKVYFVGKDIDSAWSKEFCGGPHVDHTGIIGHFKIAKEEAIGAGTRRIRGILN